MDADFVSSRLSRMATTFPTDLAIHRLASSTPAVQPTEMRSEFKSEGDLLTIRKPRAKTAARPSPAGAASVPVCTTAQVKELKLHHQHYGHLPALKSTIESLRSQYDVVIVDMHAFEGSADTRAICTYVDGIIVVLGHYKKMTIERLSSALTTFGRSRLTILGSLSNCRNQR